MQNATLIQKYGLFFPAAFVVMTACAAVLVRRGLPRRWNLAIAISGIAVVIFTLCFVNPPCGSDFRIFYKGGEAVRAGTDPYVSVWMVYPPSVLPLLALMAAFPMANSLAVWSVLNTVAAASLILLATLALRVQGSPEFERPAPDLLGLLSAAMMLSLPIYWTIGLGSLAIVVAFTLLLAIYAREAGWPILAGVCLGLATAKPQTLLPFLLLFMRRSDIKTWVSMIVVSACLFAISGPVNTLPHRVHENLSNILTLSAHGNTNDYSFDNIQSHTIIGFDRLVYCLGLRNRGVILIVLLGLMGLFGIGLTYQIWRSRISRVAACSLVPLYALLFTYHRVPDCGVLALPLVYCSTRACQRVATGVCCILPRLCLCSRFCFSIPSSSSRPWLQFLRTRSC
jgi:hypothetical protein